MLTFVLIFHAAVGLGLSKGSEGKVRRITV